MDICSTLWSSMNPFWIPRQGVFVLLRISSGSLSFAILKRRGSVENKKVSANFKAKQAVVAEIKALFEKAKSAVFVDYRTLTVAEATALRVKFREAGVKYKVYKNNLVRLALNDFGVSALDERLTGTLAVAFSMNDEISAAKIIQDEKFKNKMAFKFGLIGSDVLDETEVVRLASMPSKEVLVAQLLGLIQSGARNLASVIQAVPRNLAVVINTRAS